MRAWKRRARKRLGRAIRRGLGNKNNDNGRDNSDVQSQMRATRDTSTASGMLETAEQEVGTESLGTLSGSPLLRQGSSGGEVPLLQELLNASGADLQVDGDFGPLTEAAVRAYQDENGLDVDGVVGSDTAGALNGFGGGPSEGGPEEEAPEEEGPGVIPPVTAPDEEGQLTGDPPLSRGAKGAPVSELQTLLNTKGAGLVVDGDFGPRTERAVLGFEEANDLRADGIADAEMISVLRDPESERIAQGPGNEGDRGKPFPGVGEFDDMRKAVIAAAESHLGAPYSWGANGPALFDCSGFVLYVLRSDVNLINWGDDTAHGISARLPHTNEPEAGDLVFYSSGGRVSHVEMHLGEGTREIGASGGGSSTFGDDPSAKVQYGEQTHDSRSRHYGSIGELIRMADATTP